MLQILKVLLLILALAAFLTVIFTIQYLLCRRPDARTQALLADKCDPDAEVRDEVILREGYLEEPAVAQIVNHRLKIWTVTGREYDLPLDEIKVTKVKRNNWLGRYPWWGRTLIYLEAPGTSRMLVGLRQSEAWLQKLKQNP